MKPLYRRAAAVAGPLLLAVSLTACGGDASGAPEDASEEDFCEVLNNAPEGDSVDDAKDWADELKDVGTPESIDGEAREGFEAFVDFIADADEDDVKNIDDSEDPEEIFGDDGDKILAFSLKGAEICAEAS